MEKFDVDKAIDRLGMKIDDKIKKLVVILNKKEMKTISSCGGHTNWGLPYPCVDFDIKEDVKRLKEALKKWNSCSEEKWVVRRYLDFYRLKPKFTFKWVLHKKSPLKKLQNSADNLAKFMEKEM